MRDPLSGGDEVDQLLDPAEQGGLEVGVAADRAAGSASRPGRRPPAPAPASPARAGRRASTRCPARSSATRSSPSALGPHGLPHVDVGVAEHEHACPRGATRSASAAMRLSFEPGTRWSTRTPTRRSGAGAKSRTASARWSTPSSSSTTTPSTRRSSPQTFSTSSASCLPSTQIRLPRATRARCAVHGDRAGRGARRAGGAAVDVTGACQHARARRRPRSPVRAGTCGCVRGGPRGPRRADRRTSRRARRRRPSRSSTSSTTRPALGLLRSRDARARGGAGCGPPPAAPPSTSLPYRSISTSVSRSVTLGARGTDRPRPGRGARVGLALRSGECYWCATRTRWTDCG